jgi:hypothetical protein
LPDFQPAAHSLQTTKNDGLIHGMPGATAGFRIIVTNVESVIFEWLRDAAHEHFRELSRLIR